MNKYQEALDMMEQQICGNNSHLCQSNKSNPKECDGCIETKCYLILQELVDKATPKKVIKNWYSYYCPNCHKDLLSISQKSVFEKKYCENCGQALDWSDYE